MIVFWTFSTLALFSAGSPCIVYVCEQIFFYCSVDYDLVLHSKLSEIKAEKWKTNTGLNILISLHACIAYAHRHGLTHWNNRFQKELVSAHNVSDGLCRPIRRHCISAENDEREKMKEIWNFILSQLALIVSSRVYNSNIVDLNGL